MEKRVWTVQLHEARTGEEFRKTKVAADFIEQFGVHAANSDAAKIAVRAWLRERGHKVRTIGVSAKKGDVRVLIAYVSAGSRAASAAFMAAHAAPKRLLPAGVPMGSRRTQ
jgi:hypothetical protein